MLDWILRAAAVGACLFFGVGPSNAITITSTGIAVGSVGSDTQVGFTVDGRPIGDGAIGYFIPLGDGSGTYGVGPQCTIGFGTCSDTGDGGGTLTMILRFSFAPFTTTGDRKLSVFFEDLDLKNANDPVGFFEEFNLLKSDGVTSLSGGVVTDIGGVVQGNANTQQIVDLVLSGLNDDPLFLVMTFKSKSAFVGTNTIEYLRATISGECGNCEPPPGGSGETPLPGGLLLMGTVVLAGGGIARWRRRRAQGRDAIAGH